MNKDSRVSHPSFANRTMPQNDRLNKAQSIANGDDLGYQPYTEPFTPEAPTDNAFAPGDLRKLIFLGRIEQTYVIAGYSFTIKTLTNQEQDDVWFSLSFVDGGNKILVIKRPILSRAIVSVNGRSLDTLYEGADYKDLTEQQRTSKVVASWQDALIDKIYEHYSDLVQRSKKSFEPAEIEAGKK